MKKILGLYKKNNQFLISLSLNIKKSKIEPEKSYNCLAIINIGTLYHNIVSFSNIINISIVFLENLNRS